MGSLCVPDNRVKVDGLVRLIDVALEQAGEKLDRGPGLLGSHLVSFDFLVGSRSSRMGCHVDERKLVDGLLHDFEL